MTNHVLLDNVTHKNLRVRTGYRPGEGYDVNVARVFPAEFARAQGEYPIFLVRNADSGDFEATALLGFDEGENLYLGDDGWSADYVPMSIERQPFLIGFREQPGDGGSGQVPVVHVDMDHPGISETEGEPVFLPQGGESPYLQRINSILKAIHQGHEAARSLSQALEGLELIESLAVDIEFDDGSKQSLAGLYTINEDRLEGLGGGALEALHRRGHLQDAFMLLASLQSLPRLIERKNRKLRG